jgi:hypothetical protein
MSSSPSPHASPGYHWTRGGNDYSTRRTWRFEVQLHPQSCSLCDLLEEEAEYFGLGLPQARALIKKVGTATAKWRDVAQKAGARPPEIHRMASASNTMICGELSHSEERRRHSADESSR